MTVDSETKEKKRNNVAPSLGVEGQKAWDQSQDRNRRLAEIVFRLRELNIKLRALRSSEEKARAVHDAANEAYEACKRGEAHSASRRRHAAAPEPGFRAATILRRKNLLE